jgi:hypothetical protein
MPGGPLFWCTAVHHEYLAVAANFPLKKMHVTCPDFSDHC